jgi:hypothetical protein
MKTIVILIACLGLLMALAGPAPARAEDGFIGSVRTVSGEAFVERQGRRMPAHIKLRIKQNDALVTGSDGALGVILRDDTILSVGPNSRLIIDRFLFSPSEKKFGLITTLLKGTASYLSGLIEKLSPGSVRMKTPVATIGTRGTGYAVKVDQR